jgi:hypothetical protein
LEGDQIQPLAQDALAVLRPQIIQPEPALVTTVACKPGVKFTDARLIVPKGSDVPFSVKPKDGGTVAVTLTLVPLVVTVFGIEKFDELISPEAPIAEKVSSVPAADSVVQAVGLVNPVPDQLKQYSLVVLAGAKLAVVLNTTCLPETDAAFWPAIFVTAFWFTGCVSRLFVSTVQLASVVLKV